MFWLNLTAKKKKTKKQNKTKQNKQPTQYYIGQVESEEK